MKLACEGCNWMTEADTADELHAAMMAHGEEAHSNHFEGKSPDEIREMKKMMDAHVRQMIADQN
jgi:predicted small metal-binding protein